MNLHANNSLVKLFLLWSLGDSSSQRRLVSFPNVLPTLMLAILFLSSKCGNGCNTTSSQRGLICWQLGPCNDSPVGPDHTEDEIHQKFKCPKDPFQLGLCTNTSHAACPLAQRSPGERCAALGGTACVAKQGQMPSSSCSQHW